MKIEREPLANVRTFREVPKGEAFELPNGMIYIKTASELSLGSNPVNAIRLSDGASYKFDQGSSVLNSKVKVVVSRDVE